MKKRLICIVLSITVVLSFLMIRFVKYYSIACENYSNSGIKASVTIEINDVLANAIEIDKNDYGKIIDIKYGYNNEITAIEIDSGKINNISNYISTKINEKVIDCEHKYGIPLGNALGSRMFSGYGPKISVRILPVGAVSYKIKSEIISGGINQTIHRITVDYFTEVRCLAPFDENVIIIENSVILAETLIVGKVPNIALSPLG